MSLFIITIDFFCSWNNLIGRSSATMKKLRFKFEPSNFPNELSELKKFTEDLSRQYHSIHIEKNFGWGEERFTLFEKIGKEARCVLMKRISKCFNFTDAESLDKFFECLPKLETIVIISCFVNYISLDMSVVTLPHLKSVVIDNAQMNGVSQA